MSRLSPLGSMAAVLGGAGLALAILVGCEQDVALVPPGTSTGSAPSPTTKTGAELEAELKVRIDQSIKITGDRVLNKDVNNAWQVIHGIIAYGRDLNMRVGDETVKALPWLFEGNFMKGWELYPGTYGKDPKDSEKPGTGLYAKLEPGSSEAQGHPDQWIGYFACAGVKLDDPIIVTVGGVKRTYRFRDMLDEAKWKIVDGMEATWTLMALASYVGPEYMPIDATWTAEDGGIWNLERIVGMEADAGIEGAACGGAHRLYALAIAIDRQRKAGKPMTGGWSRAEALLSKSINDAFAFQQPDGGFSNDRFVRSSITPDVDARIDSTGHVLEVLALAVDDNELRSGRMRRAVEFLCKKIEETKIIGVGCGGLYHGAHGLMIYRERMFGKPEPISAE
jgi:hypothetical protein